MASPLRRLGFARDTKGVAAVEFAMVATLLAVAAVNVADIAIYTYQRMELQNAAQMGAIAAAKACNASQLPAIRNCPGVSAIIAGAIQSTSLGSAVTLTSGYPSEGYYCVNALNALQYVSDTSSKPLNCLLAGTPLLQPGDYIKVQVTYTYTPLFAHLSVASLFTTPVVTTALLRLS